MMSLISLLGTPLSVMLSRWNVIVGVVLILAGILLFIFSKRIAMIKHNKDEVAPSDSLVVALRVIGICLLLVGLVLIALPLE